MNQEHSQAGTVITFYSFKGGTGRSMALANVAYLLGAYLKGTKVEDSSQRVLLIDWDLEAPGLHRYFSDSTRAQDDHQLGLIDYFCEVRETASTAGMLPDLERYIVSDVAPHVDLIKSGRFDHGYGRRVNTFDWVALYEMNRDIISSFRKAITSQYSYCLVDSRTGVTDISGICTMLLPEKLAAVFTPNSQSLDGLLNVLRDAVNYRKSSDDFRPLSIFPVPSRIDLAEQKLREIWRKRFQAEFQKLFQEIYDTKRCDLSNYFDKVQIPHLSYYAYGEPVAAREPGSDLFSLKRSYEYLYEVLIGQDSACASTDGVLPKLDLLEERGPQRWEKKLTATDAQRQIGNPTGDIRLTKAGWKVNGKLIDNTTYFRYVVFGGCNWTRKDEKVEEALVPFDVKILGKSYGVNTLVVSHKPSGEADQHNYTTGIQWGTLAYLTRQVNLTNKLLRLYAPPAGREEPYFIEIL
jgi:hypothetical protein